MIDDRIIDQWLVRLSGHEGGYSNRSKIEDPGGETKWGISKRSYPHLDIKNLTKEEAREIYKRDFIGPIAARDLPNGIGFQLFDFAVNSGMQTATKQVQKALKLKADGVIGPITREKIRATSDSDLVMLTIAARIKYMKSLNNWKYNYNGWMDRIAMNLIYGTMDT